MRLPVPPALALSLTLLLSEFTFGQTTNGCLDLPVKQQTCSANGINRNCDLFIDRLRPVAPPTVYLRRGDTVTVHVINATPFETLSLDFKTAGDTTPPDQFANEFSSISPTITKVTFVDALNFKFVAPLNLAAFVQDPFSAMRDKLKQVAATQRILFSEYDPSIITNEILIATQPPPANACTAALTWDDKGYPNPWLSPGTWGEAVVAVLTALQSDTLTNNALALRVHQLDPDVQTLANYTVPAGTAKDQQEMWVAAVGKIKQRQANLDALATPPAGAPAAWGTSAPASITPPSPKTDQALIAAINNLQLQSFKPTEKKQTIIDLSPSDKNITAETWSLDYVNNLQSAIKSATATTPSDASSVLTAAPSITAIASVNVTYQRPPRLEIATGVMAPFRSYHSYSAAEAASGGTVTGTVVQESNTYTVIPMAMTNIVLGQGLVKSQPLAGFFSIGVGYNPATSSIEFGAGPSISYRSIIVSPLADIGQDTHLVDGFKVGQSLPSTNTKPLTTNYWFGRPAIGLSVRIPLGGGQSGSPSSSGTGSGGSGSGGGKH